MTDSSDGLTAFRQHRALAARISQAEALRAATTHGLLGALVEGGAASAGQLAERCSLDPEAVSIVLRILADDELVSWDGELFRPGTLLSDGSFYLHSELWKHTGEFLARGERGLLEGMRPAVYKRGVKTLAHWWSPAATMVTERVSSQLSERVEILDFGAGGGTWSLPFLAKLPHATATCFDFAPVTEHYLERAREAGCAERVSCVAGDYNDGLSFSRKFDLIVIGMVLHLESEERAASLVRELVRFLNPAGKLLIVDAFGDRRPGTAPPTELRDLAVYELSLALRTHEGRPHSQRTYEKMAEGAGLEVLEAELLGPECPEIGYLLAGIG